MEVTNEEVWSYVRAEGVLGASEMLVVSKAAEVTRGVLVWFGQRDIWGSVEASVLLQVFYRLTVGLENWKRNIL